VVAERGEGEAEVVLRVGEVGLALDGLPQRFEGVAEAAGGDGGLALLVERLGGDDRVAARAGVARRRGRRGRGLRDAARAARDVPARRGGALAGPRRGARARRVDEDADAARQVALLPERGRRAEQQQ
jgi:hypothetical protein